jgi:hypothetical protein
MNKTTNECVTVELQEYNSSKTSRPQIASVFKLPLFKPNTRNADIGGGKYDIATEYLKNIGIVNIVIDKFNRSDIHNRISQRSIDKHPTDTATVNNVLNVIKEQNIRKGVIHQAMKAIKPDGVAYFLVFEGSTNKGKVAGDGIGRETSMGWQNYLKTKEYIPEVMLYFNSVIRKGNLIIAKSPKYK